MNQSRNVLVTGGAGYIGAQVCKSLHESGFIPVTLDNLSTGYESNVKWGPFLKADLRYVHEIENVFSEYEFCGVIHLAARAYVEESTREPIQYFEANISTTANLLSVSLKAGVSNVVFSSSCATYGEVNLPEILENHLQQPINPYGFTKLACEQLMMYTAISSNLKYGILRFFNAAGANVASGLIEKHFPETHVIPLAIEAALSGGTFKIFGNRYDTPDGTAIRDFIHILDLASAHVAALNRLLAGEDSFVCNLGSGNATSIQAIVDIIRESFPEFRVDIETARLGDPSRLVANIERARKLLDWSPVHSGIKEVIESSIQARIADQI